MAAYVHPRLQGTEGRPAVFVVSDDLAVEDGCPGAEQNAELGEFRVAVDQVVVVA